MPNHKNKGEDKHNYGVCVIDIGSPRLGNIGWSLIDGQTEKEWSGDQLDQLFPLIPEILDRQGLLLGLEAPLFVPLRSNLLHATKARKGEERRPWSAGGSPGSWSSRSPGRNCPECQPALCPRQWPVRARDCQQSPG